MKTSTLDRLRDVLQMCSLCAVIVIAYNGGALRNSEAIKVMLMVMIGAGNLLFGKLFCSNLCPLGLVQEWIWEKRKREYAPIEPWSATDKVLRSIKYILLVVLFVDYSIFLFNATIAILVFSVVIVGNMFFCKYLCPINAASNIFRLTVMFMATLIGNWALSMAGIAIPLWVVVAVMGTFGYILEITAKKAEFNISMLHIHRDITKCKECGKCNGLCPYKVDIKSVKRVTHIDCNLCGECVRGCGNDALKVGICHTRPGQNRIRGVWFAPLITLILLAIALWIL